MANHVYGYKLRLVETFRYIGWESAFVSDWLRKQRAFLRPIKERTAAKPMQYQFILDPRCQLKTDPYVSGL